MYGAMIGDIVGSKYEFHNIKTKKFPLFSEGCDYTDDTVMTVAVAEAIMRSRQSRENPNGKDGKKGFREYLVEAMQDFGRKYPHPMGAYGGNFAGWLGQKNPKPYGSYGNGSAMRVSPCGLAAVTMEEALALARASADVTHNHPEGIKGAEAVAAAVFMAKCGRPKEEIGSYIGRHYYDLDFTLDSIRKTYTFHASCQRSVPQAIVAFLESESFEDAVRNVISIGGDCDTTGAITGSIAWAYYAVKTGGYDGWVYNRFDPAMLEIKKAAMEYLPEEFIAIADAFHEMCWRRAGSYERTGGCIPILNQEERKPSFAGRPYTLDYFSTSVQENRLEKGSVGSCILQHDKWEHTWRLRIQLDEKKIWFLSVFLREDGGFDKYSLDEETASDSHYEFQAEPKIREKLYLPGDENRYFHEILIRYIKEYGGLKLMIQIEPYITAQYHYD